MKVSEHTITVIFVTLLGGGGLFMFGNLCRLFWKYRNHIPPGGYNPLQPQAVRSADPKLAESWKKDVRHFRTAGNVFFIITALVAVTVGVINLILEYS